MREELVVAATFDPPDAQARYQRWRDANHGLLDELPPEAVRVDIGRALSGTFVRVWLPQDILNRVSPE